MARVGLVGHLTYVSPYYDRNSQYTKKKGFSGLDLDAGPIEHGLKLMEEGLDDYDWIESRFGNELRYHAAGYRTGRQKLYK